MQINNNGSDQDSYKLSSSKNKFNKSEARANPPVDMGAAAEVCSLIGEADLHKHIRCEKNPDHTGFIPFDAFNIQHLPKAFQDKDIFNFIVSVARLTVRIQVKMTSPKRPDFWPGSEFLYPCGNMKGLTNLRYGSGRIKSVNLYNAENNLLNKNKVCHCKKCKESTNRSKSWAEIEVLTATHVVFDITEALHTSCQLFYDTPTCEPITLYCSLVKSSSVETDHCQLTFPTCDFNLLADLDLESMCKKRTTLRDIVNIKYQALKDVPKFTFVVSHPHGCFKQVSFGELKEYHNASKTKLGPHFEKLGYDCSTCPGSSGAPVFVLGFNDWEVVPIVHSGYIPSGSNYSSRGVNVIKTYGNIFSILINGVGNDTEFPKDQSKFSDETEADKTELKLNDLDLD